MSRGGKRIVAYAVATGGLLAFSALAVTAMVYPEPERDARHCIVGLAPPKTTLIALDVSDPLVAAQPHEVDIDVEGVLQSLRSGDHVLVADAAGKPPSELAPVVDQCHPGESDNNQRNTFRQTIVDPIERHLERVRSEPPARRSPLIETIIEAASDKGLRATATHLEIAFLTDGLQNSKYVSVYVYGWHYPDPPADLLKGVTVELFILKNERDAALQPLAVKRLVIWLKAAGAKVVYTPPAWLVFLESTQSHRSKRSVR